MNYSTYISAADKLSSLGQKDLSKRFIEHANSLEDKKISIFKFDILVGEVKEFKGAKYHSIQVLRERECNTLITIFTSGENTHRINSTIKPNGELVWNDGNLFSNRKSVNDFTKLVNHLKLYKKDLKKILKEMGIDGDLSTRLRTYYK